VSGGTWHPDGCRCSGCRPSRNAPRNRPATYPPRAQPGTKNGGNRPVYRYPPRSHTASCLCPRCVQCRNRPSPSSGLIAFDFGCLTVILAIAGIGALIKFLAHMPGFLSRLTAETWLTIGVCAGALVLIGFVARAASTRAVRPPKGRLRVEATPQPPSPSLPVAPQPPPCYHLNAVPVDLSNGERVAWLCPYPPDGCGEALPGDFGHLVRPCCGTPPGTGHFYNCPESAKAAGDAPRAAASAHTWKPGTRAPGRCPGCGEPIEKTPDSRFPFVHTANSDFACPK